MTLVALRLIALCIHATFGGQLIAMHRMSTLLPHGVLRLGTQRGVVEPGGPSLALGCQQLIVLRYPSVR